MISQSFIHYIIFQIQNMSNQKQNGNTLTQYLYNNNPTTLTNYINTSTKTNSLSYNPQSQIQTQQNMQQTVDNVTTSFKLNNHIEYIPMANSIFKSQIIQQQQQLLLQQPITPITNMNYYNMGNSNSIIGSKLSNSYVNSLENTQSKQQINNNYNNNLYNNHINQTNYTNHNNINNRIHRHPVYSNKSPQTQLQNYLHRQQQYNPQKYLQNHNQISQQKQYKQIQKRLSENIRVLSNRSKSRNVSELSNDSRRQSINSSTSYKNYGIRYHNKNGKEVKKNQNQEKVKVLSKIVQKLKNQQKGANVNIQYHDRNNNRPATTHQNPNGHRKQVSGEVIKTTNAPSRKIQDLLKDIKQLNKQNCKAIYTIKRTTAKQTPQQRHQKNIQQDQDIFYNTNPINSHHPDNIHMNKDGSCPTCGCTCQIKRKQRRQLQFLSTINNALTNAESVLNNNIRYV